MRVIEPLSRSKFVSQSYLAIPWSLLDIWEAGKTYEVGNRVYFQNWEYEAVASNTDKRPDTTLNASPPVWVRTGAVNRLKAFDGRIYDKAVSPASEAPTSMRYDIEVGSVGGQSSIVDTVALFNVSANRVTIAVLYQGTEVFSASSPAFDDQVITNWSEFFFNPFVQDNDFVFSNLYVTHGHTLRITLARHAGRETSVGQIVVGRSHHIGEMLEGTQVGIQDYSRKERDEWGGIVLVERPFASMADYKVAIPTKNVRAVRNVMAKLRATAAVFFDENASDRQPTLVYGFYKSFDVSLSVGETSFMDLEVEGLV